MDRGTYYIMACLIVHLTLRELEEEEIVVFGIAQLRHDRVARGLKPRRSTDPHQVEFAP